ncbi:MAG: hypothetical protein WCB18_03610 [Thermoplasmata archaeon]
MTEGGTEISKGMVEGLIEALMDRQSQLDVQLKGLTVSLAGTPLALQMSGKLTVSVHLRELTDEEKEAHSSATVAQLRA